MIKKLLLFAVLNVLLLTGYAQYCGNSGSFQCTASNLSLPWLTPPPDSLAPFVNGQPSTTVIQFKNFNTVYFSGSYYTVNSLRIDSVDNLPSGLCWATNKADNTYANQESGCIKVNGVPCGPTGQYKMRIIVSVDLGFGIAQVNADQAGLKYYIRLKNNGDADTPVDSNQTAANPFIPYGGSCASLPLVAYLGTDQNVCSGSIATLNPVISGGQAPFTYAWSATGNSLSCSNCANPTVTLTQNSTYTVTVTDANNATSTDVISYTVTGSGNTFQINAGGATTFCQGNSVLLGGTSSAGFTYQWLQNNVNVSGATATSLTANSSGNYVLVFTSSNGCYATSNVITVNVLPRPDATVTLQPATACQGDTIQLIPQTDTSVHYFGWGVGNSNVIDSGLTYNATISGQYFLTLRNSNQCTNLIAFSVGFIPAPIVGLAGNPDSLCNNASSITLTGATPAGGVFSGTGVTGITFNPTAAGLGPHVIFYTFTDTSTCSNKASEVITVVLCTGINDLIEESMIALYPNPVNDLLTVESPLFDNSNLNVAMFDVTGKQQAINYKLEAGKVAIRTEVLAAGIYWIKFNMNGKEVSRKFVKAE